MRHDVHLPLFVEVDEIFNMSCQASPVHYPFDSVSTTKTFIHGAMKVLDFEKRIRGCDTLLISNLKMMVTLRSTY